MVVGRARDRHIHPRSQVSLASMKVDRADMELLAQEAEFRNIPRTELIRLAIKAAAADWRSSPDRPRPCRARGCGRAAAWGAEYCKECGPLAAAVRIATETPVEEPAVWLGDLRDMR